MNEDFVKNGLNYSNVRYDFAKMTKRFGEHYLDYLATTYATKDELPDKDFQEMNGNVPDSFMPKVREMASKVKVIVS